MGWTGMFNWDRSEKNSEILNREFFSSVEKKYEPLKWADKGGHTWLLYRHIESGTTYAAVILCQRSRKDHEFFYKEIGLSSGPCEVDMPASWIPLIKDTYKDDKFAQDWFRRYEESKVQKKSCKYDFGDVLKCHNGRGAIRWGNGYKIEENSDFYVMVEPHQTRSRTTKLYMIAVPNQSGGFYTRPYRIGLDTLKNLNSVEVVRSGK